MIKLSAKLILCFIFAHCFSQASQVAVKSGTELTMHVKKAAEVVALAQGQLDEKQLAELKVDPSKFTEHTIQHDKIVTAVAVNKQKTLIAIGDRAGNTYVRDFKTNKIITILFNDDPRSLVRCIKFHPERNVIVVGYSHRTLDNQVTGNFPLGEYLITFKSTQQFLVWFDLDSAEQVHLDGHSDWVTDIDFSPDGSILASISDDFKVILWDTIFKKVIHRFKDHESYGRSISFNADGTLLASAAFDGKVNVYDLKKECLLWSKKMNKNATINMCCDKPSCKFLNFTNPAVASFHPTEPSVLAAIGTDNEAALIDARSQEKITSFDIGIRDKKQDKVRPYFKWISTLIFNADGSKLSLMHDCGSLTTWHLHEKDNNVTWVKINKACHIYGSMAHDGKSLYAGYGCTSDNFEKFKQERSTASGFVFKWDTDINHG